MALPACVVFRRNERGVQTATLGIDLASTLPAPPGKGVRFDVYPNGRLALTPEPGFRLQDALHEFGIAVVKGRAVFHDAAGSTPLFFREKGDGYAL